MSAPELVSATAQLESGKAVLVELLFDQALNPTQLLDPLNYSIDGGLLIEGVKYDPGFPLKATLKTTAQIAGRRYVVTVSSALKLTAPPFTALASGTSAEFLGATATSVSSFVSNLNATSHPHGQRIDLSWTNPPGTVEVKVFRRLKAWPFDLTGTADGATVIYTGAPITSLSESGLIADTFYYYTVCARTSLVAEYEQNKESRVMGYSAAHRSELGSTDYVRRLVPSAVRKYNGEGLDKFLRVLGGASDLLRGAVSSVRYLSDWREAPYVTVLSSLRSMGCEPEGETYDFDTPRRLLLQIRELNAKRGSVDGIIQAVDALVHWIVEGEQFGLDPRQRLFGAAGLTGLDTGSGATVSYSAEALVDASKVWANGLWANGRLLDGLGNWFDVLTNTGGTTLELAGIPTEPSPYVSRLTASAAVGANSVVAASVIGLRRGQRVQLVNTTNGDRQIVDITAVDGAAKTIYFWNELQVGFPATDSVVSWKTTTPMASYIGRVGAGSTVNSLLLDAYGGSKPNWPASRWVGMVVMDSSGGLHTVTSSTADALTFADGFSWVSGSKFTLAPAFSAGFPVRSYQVHTGYLPYLFNVLFDQELRGTRYDPLHYLPGKSLYGAYGPCDFGLYVLSDWLGDPVTESVGRATAVSGNTITDSSASHVPGAYVGMMLLPNQNSSRMFEITGNTATTVTASGNLEAYSADRQTYVILSRRNAERYRRLLARLPEFCGEINPLVLFL